MQKLIKFILSLFKTTTTPTPVVNTPVAAAQPQPEPIPDGVTITRTYTDKETFGDLVAYKDGKKFTCKTLELPWLNNQHNISCVPEGVYTCTWCFKGGIFGYVYQIQNVPGRDGVLIHSANFAAGKNVQLEGCVAVGSDFQDINGDGILDIINSKITLKAFEDFMQRKNFTLHITK